MSSSVVMQCMRLFKPQNVIWNRQFRSRKPAKRLLTFHNLHRYWLKRFKDANIEEPEQSAGYIVAHMLKKKTFSLVRDHELMRNVSEKEIEKLKDMCERRLNKMPVQYVIEEWDFHGLNLKTRPPVFIPRPETEQLVDLVIGNISERLKLPDRRQPLRVFEIGCGSGAITLSLLNHFKSQNVEFFAIDTLPSALKLTIENARNLRLDTDKLKIFRHHVGKDDERLASLKSFDVIVSNPPYIPSCDMSDLAVEISRYEHEGALHGGIDGLDVIRDILRISEYLLTQDGSLWLETDHTHPSRLAENAGPLTLVSHYDDIFGTPRFCHLQRGHVSSEKKT